MCKRDQAASLRCVTSTATPSTNFLPPWTASSAYRRRNLFSAIIRIFHITASALALRLVYSSCHLARTRAIDGADGGALSPGKPRGTGPKSPPGQPVRVPAVVYAKHGIRVDVTKPAVIMTQCHCRMIQRLSNVPRQLYLEQYLKAKFVNREKLPESPRLLASDESSQLTGQSLAVDGGIHADSHLIAS